MRHGSTSSSAFPVVAVHVRGNAKTLKLEAKISIQEPHVDYSKYSGSDRDSPHQVVLF